MTVFKEPGLSAERPFPGLRPFGIGDKNFFFGRTDQIYALYRLISRSRFVAVVGSSGSGKSSLVRSGLRALLEEENKDRGRRWVYLEMRPGNAPLARLADALASVAPAGGGADGEEGGEDERELSEARRDRILYRLQQSSFGISEALTEVDGLSGASLVLVVDQFEELFRYRENSIGKWYKSSDEVADKEESGLFIQLLLEVNRRRSGALTILLTMRSDFIGECGQYQGLAEAVGSTLFLVPALTRDQREEVIRRPIEQAGASIEAQLVERMLNDAGREVDGLPILQHCLLRLWDASVKGNPAASAARRLTLQQYLSIGGMGDALSRHADEVLASLDGVQAGVEQVIRALAEVDRQGRATRRALPYGQLLAETGLDEPDLRRIIDRFRAEDCAFLMPTLAASPALQSDTPIDVGHEALLRRWRKVSGEELSGVGRTGAATLGWLRAEQDDGDRYRLLLALVASAHQGAAELPPAATEDWWRWWNSGKRTAAWAERYGGRFDLVNQLLETSVAAANAAKRRRKLEKRVKRFVAAAGVVIAASLSGLSYLAYWQSRNLVDQRANSAAFLKLAIDSSSQFLDQVLVSVNRGDVKVKGARDLTAVADRVVRSIAKGKSISADSKLLLGKLLLLEADLAEAVADYTQSLQLVDRAKAIANELVATSKSNGQWLQLLYAATLRRGNELIFLYPYNRKMRRDAAAEYAESLLLAQRMEQANPADERVYHDLLDARLKLGDVLVLDKMFVDAAQQYELAAAIADSRVGAGSKDLQWRRWSAVVRLRAGGVQIACKQWRRAHNSYASSIHILEDLIRIDPDNNVIQSNLVASRTQFAELLQYRYMPTKAYFQFKRGVETYERLASKDLSNPRWIGYVAIDHTHLADVLWTLGRRRPAIDNYAASIVWRQRHAQMDTNSIQRKVDLARSIDTLGDHLSSPDEISERLSKYKDALRILEDINISRAEQKPMDTRWLQYVLHVKIGNLLASRLDWAGAAKEWVAARRLVRQRPGKESEATAWEKLLHDAYAQPVLSKKKRGGLRRLGLGSASPPICVKFP